MALPLIGVMEIYKKEYKIWIIILKVIKKDIMEFDKIIIFYKIIEEFK